MQRLTRFERLLIGAESRFLARHMFSREHRLIIGFSPKAACTVGAKMFFNHIGRLDEALAFDPWIHNYREEYLKTHVVYPRWHWNKRYLKIKLVRNPYTRVISGYTHAMIHPYMDEQLTTFFGIKDRRELSFSRFLEFLEARINGPINPHNGLQVFKEELHQYPYDHVLKIEELEAGLADIRARRGVDLKVDERILNSGHHLPKYEFRLERCSEVPFSSLAKRKDGRISVPPHAAFYDPVTLARVSKLFEPDISTYGYQFEPG